MYTFVSKISALELSKIIVVKFQELDYCAQNAKLNIIYHVFIYYKV